MVTVRLRRNGPLVIEGDDVRVVDWDGVEQRPTRRPVALCRCGGSASKPFCDGSHKRIGFNPDPASESQSLASGEPYSRQLDRLRCRKRGRERGARRQHHVLAARSQHGAGARGAADRRALGGTVAAAEDAADHRAHACADADLGGVALDVAFALEP